VNFVLLDLVLLLKQGSTPLYIAHKIPKTNKIAIVTNIIISNMRRTFKNIIKFLKKLRELIYLLLL
jgi:DeoR/GlpR family transcriptional regulator of sugar metabolism